MAPVEVSVADYLIIPWHYVVEVLGTVPDTTKFEPSLSPKPVMVMSRVHAVSLKRKAQGNVPSFAKRDPI
jgi:hypothetical protein